MTDHGYLMTVVTVLNAAGCRLAHKRALSSQSDAKRAKKKKKTEKEEP